MTEPDRGAGSPSQFVAAAAALGVDVDSTRAGRLLDWLDAMLAENRQVNLTAVRERDAAIVLHALDSVAIGRAEVDPARSLDLGSGNGFPGVGVWCAFPEAVVTLLERTQKKVLAIDRCLAAVPLDGVTTLCDDAAQLPAHGKRKAYTLVTARAVGEPRALLKLAKPLVARGGKLALWLADGTEVPPAFRSGFATVAVVEYDLPEPAVRRRRIAIYAR